MGATCVDGAWSPSIIPTCLPRNHPKIKYDASTVVKIFVSFKNISHLVYIFFINISMHLT